jgi:hypothetical protein
MPKKMYEVAEMEREKEAVAEKQKDEKKKGANKFAIRKDMRLVGRR